jgi:hypothetical protein
MDEWNDRKGGGIGWASLGQWDGMKLQTAQRHISLSRRRIAGTLLATLSGSFRTLCGIGGVGWATDAVGRFAATQAALFDDGRARRSGSTLPLQPTVAGGEQEQRVEGDCS